MVWKAIRPTPTSPVTCKGCNRTFTSGSFHVHHIKPRRWGGTDDADNVQSICSACHKKIHKFYIDLALERALGNSPHFFEECMTEFMDGQLGGQ